MDELGTATTDDLEGHEFRISQNTVCNVTDWETDGYIAGLPNRSFEVKPSFG